MSTSIWPSSRATPFWSPAYRLARRIYPQRLRTASRADRLASRVALLQITSLSCCRNGKSMGKRLRATRPQRLGIKVYARLFSVDSQRPHLLIIYRPSSRRGARVNERDLLRWEISRHVSRRGDLGPGRAAPRWRSVIRDRGCTTHRSYVGAF